MEKDRFLSLVQNYTSLTEAEAIDLNELQRDFPFSQVIHNLATRAAQDNHLPTHDHLLRVSAVYSTDRAVLKEIMTQPKAEFRTYKISPEPVGNNVVIESPYQATNAADKIMYTHAASTLSGDKLISEIQSDLYRLKELRHNFEVSLQEFEQAHASSAPLLEKKNKRVKGKEKEDNDPLDGLIEEIKISKKEIDPEGERQKEQFHIIDQFIRKSPIIGKGKTVASTEEDLDLAEKSSAFGDHIISETLVDILLKQGKTDKAIEVLRKLIWKFPQKKAIFAAQIEILRK